MGELSPLIFETIVKRHPTSSIPAAGLPSARRNPRRVELERYLDALASEAPTPGGGSAATLVGALGAGLCAMVARLTLASPKHADVHAQARAIAEDADLLRRRLLELRPLDEDAFRAVIDAQALPRTTPEERNDRDVRLQGALTGAAEVPLEGVRLAAELLALVARTAALRNAHLMSDAECALHFGRAMLEACTINVEVNHRYLRDERVIAAQHQALTEARALALAADDRASELIRAASR